MTSPSARARPACSLCRLNLRRAFRNSSWPRRLHQKSIETAQPLILLFQEFAIGDDLCSWRFWFRIWLHDTVVAIEPLFRCVFYGEATSQFIDLRLGTRVCCENSADNRNCEPCVTTDHVFSLSSYFEPGTRQGGRGSVDQPQGASKRDFPRKGSSLIENSANQVDGNSLSVVLSKRFSSLRASDK